MGRRTQEAAIARELRQALEPGRQPRLVIGPELADPHARSISQLDLAHSGQRTSLPSIAAMTPCSSRTRLGLPYIGALMAGLPLVLGCGAAGKSVPKDVTVASAASPQAPTGPAGATAP